MILNNNLKLVVGTNVLLVSLPEKSPYHWFYQYLIQGKLDIHVTNEILSEYEEVIGRKFSPELSSAVIKVLMELDNVIPVVVHFKYQLIIQDPDDDKFANCAINTNADYILTHDRHFDVLKSTEFPVVNIIRLPELKHLLENKIRPNV